MRSLRNAAVVTLALLALTSVGLADTVLYEFESGGAYSGQGWGSYGTPTTDSGMTEDASVGSYARYHAFDMALGGWGIVDTSPVASHATYGFGDLSSYAGMTADVKLTLQTPPTTLTTVEFLLAIGEMEWVSFQTLTADYQTISTTFAAMTPQNAATEPITAAQLADPNLQIKFVMRRNGDEGKGVLRYDHITAFVPEPGSLGLLALAGLVGLRRR